MYILYIRQVSNKEKKKKEENALMESYYCIFVRVVVGKKMLLILKSLWGVLGIWYGDFQKASRQCKVVEVWRRFRA